MIIRDNIVPREERVMAWMKFLNDPALIPFSFLPSPSSTTTLKLQSSNQSSKADDINIRS